jgi:hypothetical protein
MGLQTSLWILISFHLDIYPGVDYMDHMVVLVLVF